MRQFIEINMTARVGCITIKPNYISLFVSVKKAKQNTTEYFYQNYTVICTGGALAHLMEHPLEQNDTISIKGADLRPNKANDLIIFCCSSDQIDVVAASNARTIQNRNTHIRA